MLYYSKVCLKRTTILLSKVSISDVPLVYLGGFEKSRLKEKKEKKRLGGISCSGSLGCNLLTPVFGVVFGVWPLLSPTGSVQFLDPLLGTEDLSTGVMAIT